MESSKLYPTVDLLTPPGDLKAMSFPLKSTSPGSRSTWFESISCHKIREYHRLIWPTSRADILNHLDDIKIYQHIHNQLIIIPRWKNASSSSSLGMTIVRNPAVATSSHRLQSPTCDSRIDECHLGQNSGILIALGRYSCSCIGLGH